MITSLQNQRVKEALKLRDARQRRKRQCMIIDGVRELSRALDAGIELLEVFVCDALCETLEARTLAARLDQPDLSTAPRLNRVSEEVFARVAYGGRNEGLVAVAAWPRRTLEDLQLGEDPFVVVVEGVEKPGNVGAVLRTADAVGIDAVIVADAATDLYNPNCIRSSLGTVLTLPVCMATTDEALSWLAINGLRIVTARVEGAVHYDSISYRGPVAIVLGSEAHGLSSRWHDETFTAVRLPMHGAADSLNISAAAAVLMYEALRQRGE